MKDEAWADPAPPVSVGGKRKPVSASIDTATSNSSKR